MELIATENANHRRTKDKRARVAARGNQKQDRHRSKNRIRDGSL
jgi:hypothetical protein